MGDGRSTVRHSRIGLCVKSAYVQTVQGGDGRLSRGRDAGLVQVYFGGGKGRARRSFPFRTALAGPQRSTERNPTAYHPPMAHVIEREAWAEGDALVTIDVHASEKFMTEWLE
jgi:hypothetical protein